MEKAEWRLAWMLCGLTHLSVHGWAQAWGHPHMWSLEHLQSILQGKLVTRNPSRPGLWIFPTLGASAPTFPCSLIYCYTYMSTWALWLLVKGSA